MSEIGYSVSKTPVEVFELEGWAFCEVEEILSEMQNDDAAREWAMMLCARLAYGSIKTKTEEVCEK